MRNALGINLIVNPEYATACEISRILRFPAAIKTETFAKGRIELIEFNTVRITHFAEKLFLRYTKSLR